MEKIVPRWEWRTFGQDFGDAIARIGKQPAERIQKSEETYLLAAGSNSNVKIRDELLDIKLLERVDSNGLEQWRPALKAPFPLAAAAVSTIRTALALPFSSAIPDGLSLEEFLKKIAPPGGPVHIVNVSKTRKRYTMEGCVSELTDLVANGKSVRTVAVEDTDASKVIAAVRALGLERYPNVSYPLGLKQLLGLSNSSPVGSRQAVIDVGTNSVKFCIGQLQRDGSWSSVVDRAEVTRLGEGLERSGLIGPEAMERTAAAISGMKDEANRNGAAGITAVGTMGLRTARNTDAFLKLVSDRCQIAIEVLSAEDEARIAYLAVRSGLELSDGAIVIFDSGGGSSQFTFGHGKEVDRQFSVNVGAVRYTERFGLDQAVTREVLEQALTAIATDLSPLEEATAPGGALVGMGGAVTNIAAVKHKLSKYDPGVIQGSKIDRAEVDRQIAQYRILSALDRRQIVGLQPKRADVILAGVCIVKTIMEKLKSSSLSVSDRGLRHGILLDRFGGQT